MSKPRRIGDTMAFGYTNCSVHRMATKPERSHKGTSSCDDQPDNCELIV
ncbi:hypothetical protein T12_16316 [Trichinella patagoniensis]|uniref:Uncharacterized protein n=1 Tax=Trichinella patagoniensis TaxID=990121 RepID=A0A0V1A2K5_9BILA|nr:hypothetical protein T12_16316 [Trichinella patagoniensis]